MPKPETNLDDKKVLATLNQILELELAGVVRYMHYSFMIFGHQRIPITAWLRKQADESLAHSVLAGEHITRSGATLRCASASCSRRTSTRSTRSSTRPTRTRRRA